MNPSYNGSWRHAQRRHVHQPFVQIGTMSGHVLEACPMTDRFFFPEWACGPLVWNKYGGTYAHAGNNKKGPGLESLNALQHPGRSCERNGDTPQAQSGTTRDGTRTHNLLLRGEAPYPLGHTSGCALVLPTALHANTMLWLPSLADKPIPD